MTKTSSSFHNESGQGNDVPRSGGRSSHTVERQERTRRRLISVQVDGIRHASEAFLSSLLNRRYETQFDGMFRVSVFGNVDDDFDSLARGHFDFAVYFHPKLCDCEGLPAVVEVSPGVIDVQAAEVSPRYYELAAANKWKLSHSRIVEVLEFLEHQGMAKLDALMEEMRQSLFDDEPGPVALQKIRLHVQGCIENM